MQREINAQEPKLVSSWSSPPTIVQTKLYFDGAPEVYFLIGHPAIPLSKGGFPC